MTEPGPEQQPFVTSTTVQRKGGHDHVTVWVRGANVGTLVMAGGDGVRFDALIDSRDERSWLSVSDVVELAAAKELRRRGLDLARMNAGRARSDMPPLTAVDAIARINAAAHVLHEMGGRLVEHIPGRSPPLPNLAEALAQVSSEGEARARHYQPGHNECQATINGLRRQVAQARDLFRAALRGAMPVSVCDGVQAWLARTTPLGVGPCPCGDGPSPAHPDGWCEEFSR